MTDKLQGPYILWLNYGAYEGWKPSDHPTLEAALAAENYGNEFVVTKLVRYSTVETEQIAGDFVSADDPDLDR